MSTVIESKRSNLPVKVGIIGGGQLARMLSLAAYEMGIEPYVLGASDEDCAHEVVSHFEIDDGSEERLVGFLSKVDVATIENEFLDLDRLERVLSTLSSLKKSKNLRESNREFQFFPTLNSLRLVQSKLEQKKFFKKIKVPTLDFIE